VQLLDVQSITHAGTGATSFSAVFAASKSALISATCTEDLNDGTFGSTSEFSLAVPTDYLLTK
jgi:hypothetical protein